jgi:hypothetical protein
LEYATKVEGVNKMCLKASEYEDTGLMYMVVPDVNGTAVAIFQHF